MSRRYIPVLALIGVAVMSIVAVVWSEVSRSQDWRSLEQTCTDMATYNDPHELQAWISEQDIGYLSQVLTCAYLRQM